jgi:2-succinyl-5-enolpyruvyl-6-hydroxy-3-cyclohexene-1-carboxylate synthase
MSVSAFNRRWAAVILEALTRHGVRHICIAPGSRSTPLTLAAAENRTLFTTPILMSAVWGIWH